MINTGLNPRASTVQIPAFAGKENFVWIISSPAQAGACFTKARGFSPVFSRIQ